MIDFIKSNRLAIGLGIKTQLPFPISVYEETGEVLLKKQTAPFRNLQFTIIPSDPPFVTVRGSIHKFANNGDHNFDQFPLSRFREVTEELAQYISLDDPVNAIEIGVNIQSEFDPSAFIDSLIAYKGITMNKIRHKGQHSAEVSLEQYSFKIYNKGLQYNQGNILRIELHYGKMQPLFPNGLKWGDLQDPHRWEHLKLRLIKAFGELVYYDPTINLDGITSIRDKKTLIEGRNPVYWKDLTGTHKSRKLDQFQQAVRKYGRLFNSLPDQIARQLSCLIDAEYTGEVVNSYHVQPTTVSENVVNSYQNDDKENDDSFSGTYENVVNSSTILSGKNLPQATPSLSKDYPIPLVTENRFCPVTEVSISNQSPRSHFLTPIGLRWLLKTDPAKFNQLKRERLSRKYINATLDIQLREIAHSIRNEYYNPIHNDKRDISRLLIHPAVFDQQQLIIPEKWSHYIR